MKVLHLAPWPTQPLIHGGARRTAQLAEWLAAQPGVTVQTHVLPSSAAQVPLAPAHLAPALAWVAHTGGRHLTPKGAAKAVRVIAALRRLLAQARPDLVAVDPAPRISLLAAYWLSGQRVPYVVAPHNVEAVVPGEVPDEYRSRGHLLDVEAAIVRGARACLAISTLDHGLLTALGARSVYFPYFPPTAEVQRFVSVRAARHGGTRQGVLVLGSVSNAPTLNGMREMVHTLAARPLWGQEPVHVAGYRSEVLADASLPAHVRVHGTVSNEQLDALLAQVRCVVLRQPFTSGGLTRLVELNLCGVPVVLTGDYLQAAGQQAWGIHACRQLPEAASFYEDLQRAEAAVMQPPAVTLASLIERGSARAEPGAAAAVARPAAPSR